MSKKAEPYIITSLTLQGFRAYLYPKTFDFSKKRCLGVFAPNGKGKSSIADAFEFIFSDNGTLERIGLHTVHNNAGITALAHNLAVEKEIIPQVEIKFKKGTETCDGIRPAAGQPRERPECATVVKECFVAAPLIRGHSLRRFVEETTAEQRYAEVANWLQLDPLVKVQKNLRALRSQIKAAAEDDTSLKRIDSEVLGLTKKIKKWVEADVLNYINTELIKPLDNDLSLESLDEADPTFLILKERADAEEQQLGLASLRQIKTTLSAIYAQTQDKGTGELKTVGLWTEFVQAIANKQQAAVKEAEERGKAANAAFEGIWKAAEPLFAKSAPELSACPVCDTEIAKTKAGSVGGIREHIAAHKASLADYAKAKAALDAARKRLSQAQNSLVSRIETLLSLLPENYGSFRNLLAKAHDTIKAWKEGDAPEASDLLAAISKLSEEISASIMLIEKRQGEHTYRKSLAAIQQLLKLKRERFAAERVQAELSKLHGQLNIQASFISEEIRKRVQSLLDKLRTPTNEIYKKIQGASATPIRLELPPADETNQQRLNLLIDFAPNREGVQPGGYLSDSQIHSLALALRLAAIKNFNGAAPMIVLDDIVTSYDADHRRSITSMLASELPEFQIIAVTHDELFYRFMKDQLAEKDWQYLRITRFDKDYGPRFAEHKITDEMVEDRWKEGHSAANELRQIEEEWLLEWCREFAVKVHIRGPENAHSYERSELADALAAYLRNTDLVPPLVPGVNNRFLTSIQKGVVENFGSHFQDSQYGAGSIGDEQARWAEFKFFRDQFACPKCKRRKFKRPLQLNRPVCAHDNCETQFEFSKAS